MRTTRHRRGSGLKSKCAYVAAIHVDGESARLLVSNEPAPGQLSVVACREGLRSNVPEMIDGVTPSAGNRKSPCTVTYVSCLSGGETLHEVHSVPAQVRSFDERVRLDAVLAGSQWGNVASVEATGYTIGHAFRRDQCFVAVARKDTLRAVTSTVGPDIVVSTEAFALLSLLERVRPDLLEPDAGSTLALMCCSTSVTACAVSDGEVLLLHQSSLVDRMRMLRTAPVAPEAVSGAEQEVEFEFGGPSEVTAGVKPVLPAAELRAVETETSAYQSALLHLVDEVLGLAAEKQPFSPDTLLVTGEAVHRHAIAAYLRSCFGTSVHTDELDVALAVRIDDPLLAREVAGQQAQYAGALAAIAASAAPSPLVFDESRDTEGAMPVHSVLGLRESIPFAGLYLALALFSLTSVIVGGGLGVSRWYFESKRLGEVAAALESENQRRFELKAIADEWKAAEARLAHTKTLLDTINGYRQRQQTPPRLLADIRSLLPDDARLTEISFGGGVVKVSGFCESRDLGPSIALSMEQRRDSFAEVTPQTNTTTMKLPDPDTGEEAVTTVHTFTIAARYLGGETR